MCGYSTDVPAEVITIASLKGGVGKTTSSYALCAAAAAGGLRVIAIDLDPTGGLSNALERAKRNVTVIDVLHGRVSLRDALIDHPLGIRTVASHRSLNDESPSKEQLDEMLAEVRDDCDIILLDTHPHEPSLVGPMGAADRIVVPTALDILSLRAAALTVGLAQQLEVLDRIRGIVVTNAKRPLSRITDSLLNGLTLSGLAFETVLWYSPGWVVATSGRGELPDAELLTESKMLLREVATRPSPTEALRQFVGHGAGPTAEAGGRDYLPESLPPAFSASRRPARRLGNLDGGRRGSFDGAGRGRCDCRGAGVSTTAVRAFDCDRRAFDCRCGRCEQGGAGRRRPGADALLRRDRSGAAAGSACTGAGSLPAPP